MKQVLSRRAFTYGLGLGLVIVSLALGGYVLQGQLPAELGISALMAGSEEQGTDAAHAAEEKPLGSIVYNLADRVVNLADLGGFRYLKAGIALEFATEDGRALEGEAYKRKQEEFGKKLVSRKEKIDDIVTTVLSSRTATDLATAAGKESLRAELKQRIAAAVEPEHLASVYFTQFIIQ